MFEETTSAGTVVAAILEGAGFYTHEKILDTFQQFFDAGGELLFIASALFGLLLTVIYGGFRPALLLILGPSLFYFLIGYRTQIEPPVKQLGAGDAVDVSTPLKLSLSQNPDVKLRPANISWFLATTARLSSAITSTVVDLILEKEQQKELLFLSSEGALTALIGAEPSRSELQSMLSMTILQDCSAMLSAVYQLSTPEFSSMHEARLNQAVTDNTSGESYEALAFTQLQSRRTYWEEVFTIGSDVMVAASKPMKDFMGRETSIFINSGQGKNYADLYGKTFKSDPQKFISDELPDIKLKCSEALSVFGDAALVQGNWTAQFVNNESLEKGLQDTPENRDLLCKTISEKMFGFPPEVEPCQLGSIAMLYIVKNLFSSTALNRAAQSVIDHNVTTDTSRTDRCRDPNRDEDLDEFCTTVDIAAPNPVRKSINDQNSVSGENLKESIISYALNIPYYQGLILYFLAVIFPFWALLVIVPGRGGTFLLLPLAWCWIKSWDIGFALVYILDRVLWNLLPTPKLIEDGYTFEADIASLLRDLAGVDLGADIQAHYYFVGMCMIAVPVLSGYAFMRGRGEVMNIIYRAPATQAKFDDGHFSQTELTDRKSIGENLLEIPEAPSGTSTTPPTNQTPAVRNPSATTNPPSAN